MITMLRALLALSLLLGLSAARAEVLTADGQWHNFWFGDAGSAWLDGPADLDPLPAAISFEFTLNAPALFRVVDGGLAGDRFEVFNNSGSLGLTSVPTGSASDDAEFDFDAALSDPRWSSRTFNLTAGVYQITGVAALSPYGAGYGAVQLALVPEPSTWLTMIAGVAVLVFGARRRHA